MSERETILGRVREALRARRPAAGHVVGQNDGRAGARSISDVLPPVGGEPEAWVAQFQVNAAELKTDFRRLRTEVEAAAELVALGRGESWRRVATHRGATTERLAGALGLPVLLTDRGYPPAELEQCDVGITGCDCLVAQTGTVVVTTRSAGGRALSVLPPHHVVLARMDQLVPGLPEAFALLARRYGDDYPSMMSFITGPSRTGDIERILVLGAHGPKRLTVLCW